MINGFPKTDFFLKIKNGQFSFFDILQLPHTVISNSEKLTLPNVAESPKQGRKRFNSIVKTIHFSYLPFTYRW